LRNKKRKSPHQIAALHSHSLYRHFTLHIDDIDDIRRGDDEKVLYSILEEYVEKVGTAVLSPVLEDLVHRDEEGSRRSRGEVEARSAGITNMRDRHASHDVGQERHEPVHEAIRLVLHSRERIAPCISRRSDDC
jgi:hypothetical protein